jgi:hypothetical protein
MLCMVMPRSLALVRSILTRTTGWLKSRSLSETMNSPLLRAAAFSLTICS